MEFLSLVASKCKLADFHFLGKLVCRYNDELLALIFGKRG